MLAIKRPNLNNNLKEQTLPTLLLNKIEDMLERTVSIIIYYMRRDTKLVRLVDVYNNEILKEIVIDDAYDEYIKLSTDGNYLTYLDVNNNIVYYDINNIKPKIIKILDCELFPFMTNNIYYIDRNGLYYVISNENETIIFDINNNKPKYNLPISTINNIITQDYKKILCRSNDYVKMYDFNNATELYSVQLHHLHISSMSLYGDYIFYSSDIDTININNINNKLEYIYVHDDNIDLDIEIILLGIAFHPNNILVAMHFPTYILIIDMINNKIIKKIENIMFDENDRYNHDEQYYAMEFTNDGKYLIVKYSDYKIIKIDYASK
jgi:hypothetical protein